MGEGRSAASDAAASRAGIDAECAPHHKRGSDGVRARPRRDAEELRRDVAVAQLLASDGAPSTTSRGDTRGEHARGPRARSDLAVAARA